jgi:hypothetical protein
VSSNYSVLCLSHDPAIIVHDPGYNRAEQAEEAIRDGITGHEACDLMIGRYSYPLIELGCPASPGRPKHLRPNVVTCYHGSTVWTDRDWLWILAAAYQSPDPDMRAAVEKGHQQQCLPWDRLRRLRVELGFTVKEPPEQPARGYPLTSPEWQPGDGHDRCPERLGPDRTRCLFRAGHPPHGHTFNSAKPDTPDA